MISIWPLLPIHPLAYSIILCTILMFVNASKQRRGHEYFTLSNFTKWILELPVRNL